MGNIVTENIKIDKLELRDGNPNEMSNEQLESLEYSIEKFGYIQPIIVDQHNIIVDGAHRYLALKERGVSYVDVVRVNLKDDNERRLLSQTMNKLRGKHDTKKDISELEALMGYNPIELKSLLGFDETGLDILRQQAAEEEQQIMNLSQNKQLKSIDNNDNDDSEEQEELDEIITNNKCPKCNYEW